MLLTFLIVLLLLFFLMLTFLIVTLKLLIEMTNGSKWKKYNDSFVLKRELERGFAKHLGVLGRSCISWTFLTVNLSWPFSLPFLNGLRQNKNAQKLSWNGQEWWTVRNVGHLLAHVHASITKEQLHVKLTVDLSSFCVS